MTRHTFLLAGTAALCLHAAAAHADAKVSQYPSGGTIQTTDQVPVVRSGANTRVTVAPSAAVDTTNAANITSGTLQPTRLPAPSASTLGGTQSIAPASHQFMTGISTLGVPSQAQPAFSDISGNIATGQMNSGTGASSTTFWRGDGTWATPAGGGSAPGGTSGQLQYNNAGTLGGFTIAGDCSLNVGTGAITCGKTGGVNFAASATTDTTSASNITGGVLASARGGAGTVSGIVKANGSGLTSAAVAGTDYQVPLTLTTTGSSGAATLSGNTLNIPQYSGGGSVSVTSSSNDIVVSPSPGTGAFTVGSTLAVNNQAANTSYTVQSSDSAKIIKFNSASPVSVTVPAAGGTGFEAGKSFGFVNVGSGAVTLNVASGSINCGTNPTATSCAMGQGQSANVVSDGNNYTGAYSSFIQFNSPVNGSIFVSNGTNSPAGLAEVDGACVVGVSGAWSVGSCSGTSSSNLGTGLSANSPQIAGDTTSGFYTAGAGKVDVAIGGANKAEFNSTGLSVAGAGTIISTSANAFTVTNGTANVFNINASTASGATGLNLTNAAATGTTLLQASGANASVKLNATGTGSTQIGNNTTSTAGVLNVSNGSSGAAFTITPNPSASASVADIQFNAPADTALAAGADVSAMTFNMGVTRQHASGALALNRDIKVLGATHSFTAASTATDLATLGFTNPGCGINATCTNVSGLYHASAALTATGPIANSFGLNVAADTGATNNYAAQLVGTSKMGPVIDNGTGFTVTGCSPGSQVGGSDTGQFTAGTSCSSFQVAIPGPAAPNGWFCNAHDLTTPATKFGQSATTTTGGTIAATTGTVASGDVVQVSCKGY